MNKICLIFFALTALVLCVHAQPSGYKEKREIGKALKHFMEGFGELTSGIPGLPKLPDFGSSPLSGLFGGNKKEDKAKGLEKKDEKQEGKQDGKQDGKEDGKKNE
uniref:Putative secreted protein n=1 Tax=Corethrella appendiculata TaxID=1370023 RepID=U5ENL0_9DIPT